MLEIPRLPMRLTEAPILARLLMGGDRSSSAFSVFVNRCMLFCGQPLNFERDTYWGLFYERARNLLEVVVALGVGAAVNRQQVPMEHGLLVQVGIRMFPSFYDAPKGKVPMPDAEERTVGNHSVTLTGFDQSELRLEFRHLFSAGWGDGGDGSLPFDYLAHLAFESTVVRSHGGPAPEEVEDESDSTATETREGYDVDYETLGLPKINSVRLRRLVREYPTGAKESAWVVEHADDDVVWTGRRLIGAGSGDVWIQGALLLRGAAGRLLLVGWMFGRIVDDQLLDVEEFFVWPPYRRRGLGSALAGRTLLLAAATNVQRVRWLEPEADAFVNSRVDTAVPRWLRTAGWSQADENVGWGISRQSNTAEITGLLARLAGMRLPGGVHLLWTDGAMTVADHPSSPRFGLVVDRVPPPREIARRDA